MAEYRYQGRDKNGQRVSGQLSGSNEDAVAAQLVQRGITPLTIVPGQSSSQSFEKLKSLFERDLPLSELIMFIRQMYSLTKAGISMLRAIQGLAENASNKQLREALNAIAADLERGRGLSAAMAEHPRCFPRVVIAVVHVGENTGRLEESFEQLSAFLEGEAETKKRIKSATRYPTFVLVTLAIAIVLLNIFVVPTFASMFASFDVELPLITRGLLATSSFFLNYWPVLIIGVVGALFGLKHWLRQPQAKNKWDRLKLKLPAVGSIIERSLLARFCRSFSVMLNAGVPLTQAISLVGDALDNEYMGNRVQDMRKGVERGESLLKVSKSSQLFTPLVLQMISVGEETGSLDSLLVEAAEYYEREVDYDLKNIMSKLEPILVGFVAGMVLLLAMGIFLPMWGMMDAYTGGM